MLGQDLKDQAIVDNLLGVFSDIRSAYSPLFFSEHSADETKNVVEKIEKKLQYCQNLYGDK